MNAIETMVSEEYGMAATVTPNDKGGFAVAVRDTDADELVGLHVFPALDKAMAYATKVIAGEVAKGDCAEVA